MTINIFDTSLKLRKHSWFTQNYIHNPGDYFETFLYEFGTDIPNFKKMFKEARSNFGLFTQF